MKFRPDVYWLHRTALRPLLPGADNNNLIKSCKQIEQTGEAKFIHFLQEQGLAPLWDKYLRKEDNSNLVSNIFIEAVHQSRLIATASYLLQTRALKEIKILYEKENIAHAIIKGCHIRESIYEEPAIRPACDIDVLIAPENQVEAIKVLVNAGYQFVPNPNNISHETALIKGGVSIDLHWDIMRPGRTRIPMTDILLKTRKEFPTHWGFNNDATLFLMLVHPVFTKYSTAPQSSLVRVVDLAHWIETEKPDWGQIENWLEDAGVRTAAWITEEWLRQLTKITPPTSFMKCIQPGRLRTKYLRYWITKNLSTCLINYPHLIQAAFTLPAHDKFSDASLAMTTLLKVKQTAESEIEYLESATSK